MALVTDFPTIQDAFSSARHIIFPEDTTYVVDQSFSPAFNNTHVEVRPNVTFIAGEGVNRLFDVYGKSGFTFEGNGAIIDLNGTADFGISVRIPNGSLPVKDIKIKDVIVGNRPDTNYKFESAIEIRSSINVVLDNVRVEDYAQNNVPGEESYGVGIFTSENVRIDGLKLQNNFIGLLVQDSPNVRLTGFTMEQIKDNAIYVLSNSPDFVASIGIIDGAEEGFVSYSDYSTADSIHFKNMSNKGVTLRKTKYSKYRNCTFENCKQAFGDDNLYASSFIDIYNNTIVDCLEYSIFLRKLSDASIRNNRIISNVATADIIRIGGTNAEDGVNVEIEGNTIDDVKQISAAAITITVGDGGSHCDILRNKIKNAKVAVKIFKPDTLKAGGKGMFILDNIYKNILGTTYSISGGTEVTKREVA